MTAAIPAQRSVLLDVQEVAKVLKRSPSYVRSLVADGVLTPAIRQTSPRGGQPQMLFDAQVLFDTIRNTPSIEGGWWLTPV